MDELSYTGVMLQKIRDEIEAPLRAELANARLERDNMAALNSSLIAKLAAKDGIIANINERSSQYERELAEAKARVMELAKRRNEQFGRAERSEARVAGLEATNSRSLEAHYLVCKQAERAEAELKAMREALSFYADERNWHTPPHCYSAAVSDCGTKARAARDHSFAGPDGKSLAVLYCMERAEAERDAMREVLTQIERRTKNAINVQNPTTMDNFIKEIGAMARAAVAPPPAGREG